jgi:hypothetical protein
MREDAATTSAPPALSVAPPLPRAFCNRNRRLAAELLALRQKYGGQRVSDVAAKFAATAAVISTNRPNSSMPYTDTPTTTPKLSVPPPIIHIGSPPKIHANRDTFRRGHPHRLGLMTWPSERKRRHESKQRRTCDV